MSTCEIYLNIPYLNMIFTSTIEHDFYKLTTILQYNLESPWKLDQRPWLATIINASLKTCTVQDSNRCGTNGVVGVFSRQFCIFGEILHFVAKHNSAHNLVAIPGRVSWISKLPGTLKKCRIVNIVKYHFTSNSWFPWNSLSFNAERTPLERDPRVGGLLDCASLAKVLDNVDWLVEDGRVPSVPASSSHEWTLEGRGVQQVYSSRICCASWPYTSQGLHLLLLS